MTIRRALDTDVAALLAILGATGEYAKDLGATPQHYATMDGPALVAEREGVVLGFVRFWLGRPDTFVRQLVVAPAAQHRFVGYTLMLHVAALALQYGSLWLAAFTSRRETSSAFRRLGGVVDGNTARLPLSSPRVLAILQRAARPAPVMEPAC